MWQKIKDFVARIRVRVWPLIAALIATVPFILDAFSVIDITPLLVATFGDKSGQAIGVVLTIAISVLKPVFRLAPADDE